ncbi:FAD binding domain-containing protein [Choanephora cucurbitarum]|nr:FAD binding domain-containing protein [Choanephora cucurbitarum]
MITADSTPLPPPPTEVDFLVVGGGPVGLLAANLAVQAGFTVRILDIETEPNHWGRGDWIHGRTLELLERANLASELLKTGVKVEKMTSYKNGTIQKEIPFVPEDAESKYQFLLCVGQHITESSLQSQLSEHDVQVERPSTVVQMTREAESTYPVVATVMHLGKGSEQVRCKYLLGCDGAHSDIRQQLNIAYEGTTTETHAGVLDALIRTNFASRKEVCLVQSDHAKTISMFPRENGLTRIFVHFNENEHELRKEQHNRNKIQVEDIQREAKRALLPHRIEFLGILYWTVYVVGQRSASQLASEDHRVFLCGDAAHSQSPTLGQGVNTGFGDIFNLIWKICLIEKGQMNRSLLSSYHYERWPIAQKVLEVDKIASKAAAGHESTDYCQVVEKHRSFTSGFGIHYTAHSHLVTTSEEDANYHLQPGMRAPNFKVFSVQTGKKIRLFDIQQAVPSWLTFTLLVLVHDIRVTHEAVKTFREHLQPHQNAFPATQVMLVTTSTVDQIQSVAMDTSCLVMDKLNQAQCHRAYHQTNKHSSNHLIQVVVVRPDGYIGTICRHENDGVYLSEQVAHYFNQLSL